MTPFEFEVSAMQDSSYREHLNRNWGNGNKAIADLSIRLYKLENNAVNKQEIESLKEIIESQNKRINKLEKAIFEGEYINDTDNVVSYQNATESVDINDTHPVDDDNGIILEDDSPTIPSDVN